MFKEKLLFNIDLSTSVMRKEATEAIRIEEDQNDLLPTDQSQPSVHSPKGLDSTLATIYEQQAPSTQTTNQTNQTA